MSSRDILVTVILVSLSSSVHCATHVTGAARLSAARRLDCGDGSCLRACDDGDSEACLSLGRAFEAEDDGESALDAYGRGCELHHVQACRSEVDMFRSLGREGEADGLLRQRCEGSPEMCLRLFSEFDDPDGAAELEPLIRDRCRRGDSASCMALARARGDAGQTAGVEWPLRRACDAGDLEGCLRLADHLDDLGRPEEARDARRRAGELGAEE